MEPDVTVILHRRGGLKASGRAGRFASGRVTAGSWSARVRGQRSAQCVCCGGRRPVIQTEQLRAFKVRAAELLWPCSFLTPHGWPPGARRPPGARGPPGARRPPVRAGGWRRSQVAVEDKVTRHRIAHGSR
ncbi:unnamed protein product [Pleuronectes platessa]|uniref:Uncharacterized protein n=1 Tax=Pleuronectes platessa TaxID=8262 RepID=A0A9N7VLE7_PLEPL|nr:unnamed protein product [Pleuronectes platessa]